MSDENPLEVPDGPPATPTWVKVVGLAVALLVVLVAIALLSGGAGSHGPGRHAG